MANGRTRSLKATISPSRIAPRAELARGGFELRKAVRDVVERARVDAHLIRRRVDLRADAVVFVVGERAGAEHGHDLVRILLRLREHERERMEERSSSPSRARPLCASSAAAPMSPVNMFARRTAASGRPNAFAIADSTSPSCSPMRNSRSRILTTKRAPCASSFAQQRRPARSSSRSRPSVAASRSKVSPTSASVTVRDGSSSNNSATVSPASRVLRPRRPHLLRRSAGHLDDRIGDRRAADAGRPAARCAETASRRRRPPRARARRRRA